MKAITISNLFKSFDRKTYAVNGISFVAEFGRMTTLLGPSGCGKTTTLRCVAGLEKAEKGSILVGDQPIFDAAQGIDVPTEERKIGMVFQNYALWPHLNVFENIAFGLSLRGWSKNSDPTADPAIRPPRHRPAAGRPDEINPLNRYAAGSSTHDSSRSRARPG